MIISTLEDTIRGIAILTTPDLLSIYQEEQWLGMLGKLDETKINNVDMK